MKYKAFTERLMEWHIRQNRRQMPWKGIKNPYKVWLSEVILQQTRVEQGRAYYEKVIRYYPSIQALASARDEEVFKLWEGLGYYNRCKNLLYTARYISKELNGEFPDNFEKLLLLKGIGNYTASAIASFCFDLPYPVLDGNVFRVLSRVYGIDIAIDSNDGKNIFKALAKRLLYKKDPGAYNQAIMDFGATVCKPAMPLCGNCPLQNICVAFKTAKVNVLPVKEKLLQKKLRWFTYFIFEAAGKILVHKRTSKDIWQNLYEFYLVETEENPRWTNALVHELIKEQLSIKDPVINYIVPVNSQQLTHQTIKGYFVKIKLAAIPESLKIKERDWLLQKHVCELAFPKFINQHLQNNAAAIFPL